MDERYSIRKGVEELFKEQKDKSVIEKFMIFEGLFPKRLQNS